MKPILALATASVLLLSTGAQAAEPGIASTIQKFNDDFNKGDMKAAKALHVGAPTIIDEVAPHMWTGPKAFDSWVDALTKSEAKEGKTAAVVLVSAPTREVISGDRAYAISPATYTFKQKGQTLREVAQITFVMVKQKAAWKIQSWVWTGAEGVPVK